MGAPGAERFACHSRTTQDTRASRGGGGQMMYELEFFRGTETARLKSGLRNSITHPGKPPVPLLDSDPGVGGDVQQQYQALGRS